MLQVLSWMMTHPAHGLLRGPFFYTLYFFFFNDRLKCSCLHYNSLSHRGATDSLKK